MPESPDHHRFRVQGRLGDLHLQVEAALSAPWTVLFGPSGSGKSTVLRALAGLTEGLSVRFSRQSGPEQQWEVLAGPAGSSSRNKPPEQRALAYHPQHALLLPHLTAGQNIRFPETLRRIPMDRSALPHLAALLHLESLLPRFPQQLSGGERQRVSLARALAVPDARLFLLDEPFAGLDRALRDVLVPRLLAYLRERRLPVLSVTHDPDEVLLLAAEVLRLRDGRLTAKGPAEAVLADELGRMRSLLSPP